MTARISFHFWESKRGEETVSLPCSHSTRHLNTLMENHGDNCQVCQAGNFFFFPQWVLLGSDKRPRLGQQLTSHDAKADPSAPPEKKQRVDYHGGIWQNTDKFSDYVTNIKDYKRTKNILCVPQESVLEKKNILNHVSPPTPVSKPFHRTHQPIKLVHDSRKKYKWFF